MSSGAPNMRDVVEGVADLLHKGDRMAAACLYADAFRQPKPRDEKAALIGLHTILRWCLDRGRLDYAARLLWTPARSRSTQRLAPKFSGQCRSRWRWLAELKRGDRR